MNTQVNHTQVNRRDFLGRGAGGLAFAFTVANAPMKYTGEAQAATPQPNLVPVSARCSRNAQSSGVSPSSASSRR